MKPKIFIAGHRGMVGSAICRAIARSGEKYEVLTETRAGLDLRDPRAVSQFFSREKPNFVVLAAAKVGGIQANNTFPADFIYDNLMIQSVVIHESFRHNVTRLLNLGSTCIYPKFAAQPLVESSLLSGKLESTNEPYAIAKIAGIKLCESYNRQYKTDFRSVMPTNLYGPGDNFELENSHVLPAMIRKFHDAKAMYLPVVTLWGTGTPKREFLHVDDMADACMFVLEQEKAQYEQETAPMCSHINIGCGLDIQIKELAFKVRDVVGYQGEIQFDRSKPDGTPRKLVDTSRITKLGWSAKIELHHGIQGTYDWFLSNFNQIRK